MTTLELLQLLTPGVFVSGQQIAASLGVSRAAVAKAVTGLRAQGYEIEAAPKRGYRLYGKPDSLSLPLIRLALGEHPWSGGIRVLDRVDSTNDELRRKAAENAPEGTVCIADCQTAGKGRMGRSFVSPAGTGIYLSVLLRPRKAPDALMTLTAQAAVAVFRAIREVCGVCPEIKWVNDLQLGGRKICGILTELSVEAESAFVSHAIVGVGINCGQTRDAFPEELRGIAGSVFSEAGIRVDRNLLAAALIRQLSRLPELDWHADYREHCATLGKQVEVSSGTERFDAEAIDIGPSAELIVRRSDGALLALNSGEVRVKQTNVNKS